MTEELKRQPQVLDTIGKGGNYWRITEIDEEGNVVAWRLYDGTIYKKVRPLKTTVEKILDGTFRLLDIPPVTITHQEPANPAEHEEILPQEGEGEEEPETVYLIEGDGLPPDYWVKTAEEYRKRWDETRKQLALVSEENRTLVAERERREEDAKKDLQQTLDYKNAWLDACNERDELKKTVQAMGQVIKWALGEKGAKA